MGRSVRSTKTKRNSRAMSAKAKVINQNRLDSVLAKLEASIAAPPIPVLTPTPVAAPMADAPMADPFKINAPGESSGLQVVPKKEGPKKKYKKSWNQQFDEKERVRKRVAKQKKLRYESRQAHKAKVLKANLLNAASV